VRVTNLLNARYEEVLHFLTPRRAIFVGGRLDLAP
jgi:outer membrane cobalamin receptor